MISRNLNQTTLTSKRVLDISATGVPASTVPSTGTSGAGYAHNDVVAGNLFLEDVCAEIIETNLPTGWFAYSNTSLYVPSGIFDGNYYIVYKLKINGVPQTGTGTSTIRVGNALLSGPSRNLNKKSITGRNVIDVSKTGVTALTVPFTGINGAGQGAGPHRGYR
jgi:hypothetical protein